MINILKGTLFSLRDFFFIEKKVSESEKSIRHRSWDNSKKNVDRHALSKPEKCTQTAISKAKTRIIMFQMPILSRGLRPRTPVCDIIWIGLQYLDFKKKSACGRWKNKFPCLCWPLGQIINPILINRQSYHEIGILRGSWLKGGVTIGAIYHPGLLTAQMYF